MQLKTASLAVAYVVAIGDDSFSPVRDWPGQYAAER